MLKYTLPLIPTAILALVAFGAMHASDNFAEAMRCGPERLQDLGEPCDYTSFYPPVARLLVPIIIGLAMYVAMFRSLSNHQNKQKS